MVELEVIARDYEQHKKVHRALVSILDSYNFDFTKPVSSFGAFESVLRNYLKDRIIDGWVYIKTKDGCWNPFLVHNIAQAPDRDDDEHVKMFLRAVGSGTGHSGTSLLHVISFSPGDVSRRRMDAIFSNHGMAHETPALKQEYLETLDVFLEYCNQYGEQFVTNGPTIDESRNFSTHTQVDACSTGQRVILDTERAPSEQFMDSCLSNDAALSIPFNFRLRLFNLKTHRFMMGDTRNIHPYVYDETLSEKIVLPKAHRDLLDVLTTDIDMLTDDIIEGKSAGNVILCKGRPGVGKTLTAEIFSEIMHKPLYRMHSGEMGSTARSVEEMLNTVFERVSRWGCVLLLDEADVYIMERGRNVNQNAIVAEFLRSMEYFSGLMFMTTNRPDDIDDAIQSRCAAMITYENPDEEGTRKVWAVMAKQMQVDIPDALMDDLLKTFPEISPRDIRGLLRLSLRVSMKHQVKLSIDTFIRCANFRNVGRIVV
jgi:hypothetical protein